MSLQLILNEDNIADVQAEYEGPGRLPVSVSMDASEETDLCDRFSCSSTEH